MHTLFKFSDMYMYYINFIVVGYHGKWFHLRVEGELHEDSNIIILTPQLFWQKLLTVIFILSLPQCVEVGSAPETAIPQRFTDHALSTS